MQNTKPRRLGLVLAGGGARGSYHIGVWKALRELGVSFDIVTGTSVGALTGASIAQGDYEMSERVFSAISDDKVVAQPQGITHIGSFVADIIKNGGLDVTPLAELVYENISEQAVRRSGVDFGLITIRKNDLTPLELTLGSIPEGDLIDYILASAAFYPGFSPRSIDGTQYFDGGSFNNLPIALAADMGADEIIAVDLEAVGIERAYKGGLPVRFIRSYWPLGNILKFESDTARRNITLGYLDTRKAYRDLDGYAYSFERGELADFTSENAALVSSARRMLESIPVARRTAMLHLINHCDAHRNDERFLLGLLESAGETFELEPTQIYDIKEFNAQLLKRAEKTKPVVKFTDIHRISAKSAARYMTDALCDDPDGKLLAVAATALPREFCAACYLQALSAGD